MTSANDGSDTDTSSILYKLRKQRDHEQEPDALIRARKLLEEAFEALQDDKVGGTIPDAGKNDLLRDYHDLVAEADRIWAARHTLSGHWNLHYRCRRLEDRAKNFHKGIEFSATVAYMRVNAQQRQKERQRSSSRTRTQYSTSATPTSSNASAPSSNAAVRPTASAPTLNEVLLPHELFWCARYTWLQQQKGYTLRPRYKPTWIPNKDDKPLFEGRFLHVTDATTTSNTTRVLLKKVYKSERPLEPQIMAMFAQLAHKPDNHCMRLLESFSDPLESADVVILAMPFLLPWDTSTPPIETVGEAIEMLRQIFEGIYFMHRNQVAHCKLSLDCVLIDTPHQEEGSSRSEYPPRYFLTDFRAAHRWNPKRRPEGARDAFVEDLRDIAESIQTSVVLQNPSLQFLNPLLKETIKGYLSARRLVKRFDELWRSMAADELTSLLQPKPVPITPSPSPPPVPAGEDQDTPTRGRGRKRRAASFSGFMKELVLGSYARKRSTSRSGTTSTASPFGTPTKDRDKESMTASQKSTPTKHKHKGKTPSEAGLAMDGLRLRGREVIPPGSPGQRMPRILLNRRVDQQHPSNTSHVGSVSTASVSTGADTCTGRTRRPSRGTLANGYNGTGHTYTNTAPGASTRQPQTLHQPQQPKVSRRRHLSVDGHGSSSSSGPTYAKELTASPKNSPHRRYNSLDEPSAPQLHDYANGYQSTYEDRGRRGRSRQQSHPEQQQQQYLHRALPAAPPTPYSPAASSSHPHSGHTRSQSQQQPNYAHPYNAYNTLTASPLLPRAQDEFDIVEARLNAKRKALYDSKDTPTEQIPVRISGYQATGGAGGWPSPMRADDHLQLDGPKPKTRKGSIFGRKKRNKTVGTETETEDEYVSASEYPNQHDEYQPRARKGSTASSSSWYGPKSKSKSPTKQKSPSPNGGNNYKMTIGRKRGASTPIAKDTIQVVPYHLQDQYPPQSAPAGITGRLPSMAIGRPRRANTVTDANGIVYVAQNNDPSTQAGGWYRPR